MAVPKRKTSKARRDKRRANWKLTAPGIVTCPQCGESRLSHRAAGIAVTTSGDRLLMLRRRKDLPSNGAVL